MKKVIQQADKIPDKISDSPAKYSKQIILSCFNGRLSNKLPPVYTQPPLSADTIDRSWVVDGHQPASFRTPGIDEKYENIA